MNKGMIRCGYDASEGTPCPLPATTAVWQADRITERKVCDTHTAPTLRGMAGERGAVVSAKVQNIGRPTDDPLLRVRDLQIQVARMRMAIQLAQGALRTGRAAEALSALGMVPPPAATMSANNMGSNERRQTDRRAVAPDRRAGDRRKQPPRS